jgi:Ca2+/H+ antiporter
LRHQQVQARRVRSGQLGGEEEDSAGHAGHDGPSWSRAVSASVLLACTALYAVIAGTSVPNALPILPSCQLLTDNCIQNFW